MNSLFFILMSLAPTVVLALFEKPGRRHATISIGAVSIAALIPMAANAMIKTTRDDLLHSTFAWSVIGLALLLGTLIYMLLPVATSWFDDRDKRALRRRLRDRQKELEEEWGDALKE